MSIPAPLIEELRRSHFEQLEKTQDEKFRLWSNHTHDELYAPVWHGQSQCTKFAPGSAWRGAHILRAARGQTAGAGAGRGAVLFGRSDCGAIPGHRRSRALTGTGKP